MRRRFSTAGIIISALLLISVILLFYVVYAPNAKENLLSLAAPGTGAQQTPELRFPSSSPAAASPKPSPMLTPKAATLDIFIRDVGQGNCAFLRSPSGKTMLIDTGEADYAPSVIAFLSSQKIKRLDLAIATHLHSDHAGAYPELIGAYRPYSFYMPAEELSSMSALSSALNKADTQVVPVCAGAIIPWDDEVEIKVLSPIDDMNYPDENERSLILHIRYGETAILFAGDTGAYAEDLAMRVFPEEAFRADLLMAGHHGSSSSTTPRFLRAVSPSFVFISCGLNNSYGHPHQSVLNLLKKQTENIYRSDINGNCSIRMDGSSVFVESER